MMNYLLIGPEEYLKSRFLEKLKKSLLGESAQNELNFETFRAGTSPITEILDSFNTLPFASKHRITAIKDAEKFTPGEKDSVLKYLKSPAPSTTLVIFGSSGGFNKFLEEIARFAKVINCRSLAPGELKSWIREEFAGLKKKISPYLAGIISERIGNDLSYLKNEIEKISSFAGDLGEITEHHVEMVLGMAAHEMVFELAGLIAEKKPDRIFSSLEGLLAKEKPHRILGLLAWQFRRSSPPDLKQKLEIILEGDLFIKRGTMLPEEALERVLVRLSK